MIELPHPPLKYELFSIGSILEVVECNNSPYWTHLILKNKCSVRYDHPLVTKPMKRYILRYFRKNNPSYKY